MIFCSPVCSILLYILISILIFSCVLFELQTTASRQNQFLCYSTTGGGSCRNTDFGQYGYPILIGDEQFNKFCNVGAEGRGLIGDVATCNAAAISLGLPDTVKTATEISVSSKPQGCFIQMGTFPGLVFNSGSSMAFCSANSKCICFARPACALGANTSPCQCGTSACTISSGLYCDSSRTIPCRPTLLCEHTDGAIANSGPCQCGTSDCTISSGLICVSSTNTCSHLLCSDCTISSGLICDSSTDTCCGDLLDCTARTGLYCNNINNVGTCGCPAGSVKDPLLTLAPFCVECTSGRVSANPMAIGECEACPAGQYTGTSSATLCTVCEDGKYSTESGASSCQYCKVGHEYIDKVTECEVCLGGQYQPSGTMPNAECTLCPIGYYNSDIGNKDERIASKHEKCTACNITKGFVTGDKGGAMFCIGCRVGRFTTDDLSVPCQDCPAGWKGVQNDQMNTCVECNVGDYQSEDGLPFW